MSRPYLTAPTKLNRALALALATMLTFVGVVGGAYGKDSTEFAPVAGRPMPQVCFSDRIGSSRCLSQWRGQVVLLNVWATWCGPCRKEMPQLDRLQNRLSPLGFEVVALSIDQRGAPAVVNYFTRNHLRHLSVFVDAEAIVNETLSARGIPYSLLINRDGSAVKEFRGVTDWESPDQLAFIQNAIDQEQQASNSAELTSKAK